MGEVDETRRRKARAAWAFSRQSQEDFADSSRMTYDRMRGVLGSSVRGPAPTLDELHQMADAAGIDRSFMDDDFGTEEASISGLRESVAELVALTSQHQQALAELQAWRRRAEPTADDG